MNEMTEDFAPDSRTGSTAPTMHRPDGTLEPYGGHAPLTPQQVFQQQPSAAATAAAAAVQHAHAQAQAQQPRYVLPTMAPIGGPRADIQDGTNNLLQNNVGTDAYFQLADYATQQTYRNLPIEMMDRLDLLAVVGELISISMHQQALMGQNR